MSFGKTIKLNDGNVMPRIGLGTWLSEPGKVKAAVAHAVKTGYRHLDLAKIYKNQVEVGEGLKEVIPSVVKREELFLTSKLWNNAHKPHLVEKAYDATCKELGVEYLDLYLIHWPVPLESGDDIENLMPPAKDGSDFKELDLKTTLVDTWKAMIALQKTGKVKSIGVSNFTQAHLEGIISATGVVPAVNQIEGHPLLPQEDLVKYSQLKGIHITAYSPLGNASGYGKKSVDIAGSKQVQEVAKAHGVDAGQVLIAWGAHRGTSVIPKSVTPSRIESNFQEIELTDEEFEKVSSLIKDHGSYVRFNVPIGYPWDIDVFGEPEEKKANHRVNIGA